MHTPPRSTSSADVVRVDALDRERGERRRGARPRAGRRRAAPAPRARRSSMYAGQRALVRAHALHAERRRGSRPPRRARPPRRSAACPPRTSTAARSRSRPAKSTEAIMSPPVRNGSIRSSSSRAAVQHADAGRARAPCGPVQRVEVGAERARRRRASAAPPARRRRATSAPAARARAVDLGDRVDRAEHVRDVREARRACTSPRASSASSCSSESSPRSSTSR